jgi:cytidine deaminase
MTATIAPEALLTAALNAKNNAYAPYSKFAVGAAVEADNGKIYSGCNVENAAYGLTNCAERTAIYTAVSCGETHLRRLLVVADTINETFPCGACRQVMWEFNIQEIFVCNITGTCQSYTINQLLPYAFGLELKEGERKE